jgi:hypothetical protein
MLHIFKYVLSDYIDINDKRTLLQGSNLADFDLPFNLLSISIHFDNDYAFRYACKYGNFQIAQFLVRSDAIIQKNKNRSLQWSSYNGHLNIVKYLIEIDADIHTDNDSSVRLAKTQNHTHSKIFTQ